MDAAGASSNSPIKIDEELIAACDKCIKMATNGTMETVDELTTEMIFECTRAFLSKLIKGTGEVAHANGRKSVDYEDIVKIVQTEPSMKLLSQTFRAQLTYADVLQARKKKMASRWTYDYTHYNKHRDHPAYKTPKSEVKVESSPAIEGTRKSSRTRRKRISEDFEFS